MPKGRGSNERRRNWRQKNADRNIVSRQEARENGHRKLLLLGERALKLHEKKKKERRKRRKK